MKHTITKLGEGNESANSVMGNYLTELELSYHASNMIDIRPYLLQPPQANRDDCRLVDMVSI